MPKRDCVYSVNCFLLFGLPLLHCWSKWQHYIHWSADTVGSKSQVTWTDSVIALEAFSLVIADGFLLSQFTKRVYKIDMFCVWVKHYRLHETKSTTGKCTREATITHNSSQMHSFVHGLKRKQQRQHGDKSDISWKQKCSCTIITLPLMNEKFHFHVAVDHKQANLSNSPCSQVRIKRAWQCRAVGSRKGEAGWGH